jgi:uncharacterized membrane-anchored protein
MAIMFSQILGAALGDWMADTAGLGYDGGALIALLYYKTKVGPYFFMVAPSFAIPCLNVW